MTRSGAPQFTKQLLRDLAKGGRVVASTAPWEGQEVTHSPRNRQDRTPWRLVSTNGVDASVRFSGRECHSVDVPVTLGDTQRGCLDALNRHGGFPGGWMWENYSTTVRVMNALVLRGFAEESEIPGPVPGLPITRWRITEAGKAALENHRPR